MPGDARHRGINGIANDWQEIVPNDGASGDVPEWAFWVSFRFTSGTNTYGTVTMRSRKGNEAAMSFGIGNLYPLEASRIMATGTDANVRATVFGLR